MTKSKFYWRPSRIVERVGTFWNMPYYFVRVNCPQLSDVYKTWTGVHGPPHDHPLDLVHGPGLWTTPNVQKEIAPVNMKIYQRPGYENYRLVFFHQYTLITNLC